VKIKGTLRPVSEPKPVSIERGIIAFDAQDDEVVLLQMDGSDDLFLPVFTTEEKLISFLPRVLGARAVIETKIIASTESFLRSVAPHVRIAVDPHLTPEGMVRFEEVIRQEGTPPDVGSN
jgi:hypothetical protein